MQRLVCHCLVARIILKYMVRRPLYGGTLHFNLTIRVIFDSSSDLLHLDSVGYCLCLDEIGDALSVTKGGANFHNKW